MNKLQKKLAFLTHSYLAPLIGLLGKPTCKHTSNKILISIPYYIPNNSNSLICEPKRLHTDNLNGMALAIANIIFNQKVPCKKTLPESSNVKHPNDAASVKDMMQTSDGFKSFYQPKPWELVSDGICSPRVHHSTNNTHLNRVVKEFDTSTVLELRLVPLRYPYLDSTILSQYLALNSGKYNFIRIEKMIFSKITLVSKTFASNIITDLQTPNNDVGFATAIVNHHSQNRKTLPCQLTGLKFELAGRLTTQRAIPRKTVDNTYVGSFTVNKNTMSSLDFSQYTSKNKLGTFTFKV